MTIPIYIPSLGRHDKLADGPLADMSPETRGNVWLVVPPDEVVSYQNALSPLGWEMSVTVLRCDARGIAATRRWIGEYAQKEDQPHFVMMDDDVRFLVRRGEDDWRLRGTSPEELDELLATIDRTLEDPVTAHVSVSAREGNNRYGVGVRSELWAENTRTLRVLAYQTDAFLACEHGRVDVMEDFDVNLQLLGRGLRNVCLAYWAQGQKMTNAPGGCSTYRSHAVHEASARKLAELHPGVVRLVQKQNKTDREGFGTRTEVNIAWKKKHSQAMAVARRAAS